MEDDQAGDLTGFSHHNHSMWKEGPGQGWAQAVDTRRQGLSRRQGLVMDLTEETEGWGGTKTVPGTEVQAAARAVQEQRKQGLETLGLL